MLRNFCSTKTLTRILIFIGALAIGVWAKGHLTSQVESPVDPTDETLQSFATILRLSSLPKSVPVNTKLALLGEKLFFDPQFSANGKIACSTCHDPKRSFTDGLPVAQGLAITEMNTPTLINVGAMNWFFHNGRADSLAMQALGPIENPKEHGFTRIQVVQGLHSDYRRECLEIFGNAPPSFELEPSLPSSSAIQVSEAVAAFALSTLGSSDDLKSILRRAQADKRQPVQILMGDTGIEQGTKTQFDGLNTDQQNDINQWFAFFGKALAEFEKTIQVETSAFDQFAEAYLQSKNAASSFNPGFGNQEFNGYKLFVGRGQCVQCHHGALFSDQQFHNIGLSKKPGESLDLGRALGILIAKGSPYNCQGPYLKQSPSTMQEACRELDFIDIAESDLVGAFKTPTLRNLKDTGPYGHDGRFKTIRDILNFYNKLDETPGVGQRTELLKPLRFSDDELEGLELFLLSLTSNVGWGNKPLIKGETL